VRELIGKWGARGRGYKVVEQIKADLRRHGLTTDPELTRGYIDNTITLVSLPPTGADGEPGNDALEDQFLRVGSLRSASQGVLRVAPDVPLAEAMTLMVLNDYSQLAVAPTERNIRLAVSWESLGRVRLVHEVERVRDASLEIVSVNLDDPLLPLLPQIANAGFVIAHDRSMRATGIITAADVTIEFGALAEPFFLLGEIERRLRLVLERVGVAPEELQGVSLEGEDRTIESVEDLTLGQIERLLESPSIWGRATWQVDRRSFVARLRDVRAIRNGLVHFSLDVPTDGDIATLRNLLRLLRDSTEAGVLGPRGA
jgi:CBS domain-containing protein